MPPWATDVIELAKLWGPKAGPVAVVVVAAIVWALKWKRRHHLRTLLLMHEVGIHMLQNRPPTDNLHSLQQNLIWWDGKVSEIVPYARASSREIDRAQDLVSVHL